MHQSAPIVPSGTDGDPAVVGQTDPAIQVSDKQYSTNYGRGNLFDQGGNYLESGDVGRVKLDVDASVLNSTNNMFFYLMDPSDAGGVTVTSTEEAPSFGSGNVWEGDDYVQWVNDSSNDAKIWLVQISWVQGVDDFDIYWNVNDTSDGWGVDMFGTTPVPEPATMLLFGPGLIGLAGVVRRRKTNR